MDILQIVLFLSSMLFFLIWVAVLLIRLRRQHTRHVLLEKEYRAHRISEERCSNQLYLLEQSLNLNLAPVFITDSAERISFANSAFLELLGLSAEQTLGRNLQDIFSWHAAETKHHCACISQHTPLQVEYIQYAAHHDQSETQRTAMLRTLPVNDLRQQPGGRLHLLWDVTDCLRLDYDLRESQKELEIKVAERTKTLALTNEELKSAIRQLESSLEERRVMQAALEESQNRLDLVIESTDLGFWDWKPNTGALVINEQWAQLTGHTLEELAPVSIGTWRNLCLKEDLKQARSFFKNHKDHKTSHFEQQVRLRHKDGHWVWIQLRGKIVERDEQSKPTRVVGTAMDISKHMKTKERLLQSLYEFEAIFENSQVGVVYLKNDRIIARANAKVSELTGYCQWELIGESFERLHGNRKRFMAFKQRYYEELKHKGIMHLEYELRHKDGKLLPCLLSGKIVDASDPSKGFIWIIEDLHQLQQAKIQLNRQSALLAALLDSIPDIIIYKDPDGVFMGCNKAFCEAIQKNREELIGITDYDILPLETALRIREKDRQVLESCKSILEEEDIQTPEGLIKELESLRSPYYGPDNELIGLIIIHRDVSERKHSDKLRKDVELMVKHDLKTPLNVVITLPQLLLKNPDLEPKERERYLLTINKSGLLMLDLINRSLDIYKMESGSYTLAPIPFDLIALITKVAEDCGLQAKNKEVVIEFTTSEQTCTVMGEELLYYSMLANIIKNAIEAAPPEGIVRISLHCGEKIRIECSNPGLVPESMRDTFFEKYTTNKKRGGTGLGTYSAKLIVELHQGTISMRSAASEGTTITIILPAHPKVGDVNTPRLF